MRLVSKTALQPGLNSIFSLNYYGAVYVDAVLVILRLRLIPNHIVRTKITQISEIKEFFKHLPPH